MKLHAPAKINLGLRLLRRRADGYHELETFLHTLDWGDDLQLEPAEGIHLSIRVATDAPHPTLFAHVPADERNLVWKAAELVLRRIGAPGASISLTKRIPPGAGLGGGSSDAAAVIRALPALHGAELSPEKAMEAACSLGADVPFFLEGGCALAEGRGEKLTTVAPLTGMPVVLLFAGVMVPTARAYEAANYGLTRSGTYRDYLQSVEGAFRISAFDELSNDLEQAVASEYPEVAVHLDALRQTGPFFYSMTGSGSAVFGLYGDHRGAEEACRSLTAEGAEPVLARLA